MGKSEIFEFPNHFVPMPTPTTRDATTAFVIFCHRKACLTISFLLFHFVSDFIMSSSAVLQSFTPVRIPIWFMLFLTPFAEQGSSHVTCVNQPLDALVAHFDDDPYVGVENLVCRCDGCLCSCQNGIDTTDGIRYGTFSIYKKIIGIKSLLGSSHPLRDSLSLSSSLTTSRSRNATTRRWIP